MKPPSGKHGEKTKPVTKSHVTLGFQNRFKLIKDMQLRGSVLVCFSNWKKERNPTLFAPNGPDCFPRRHPAGCGDRLSNWSEN